MALLARLRAAAGKPAAFVRTRDGSRRMPHDIAPDLGIDTDPADAGPAQPANLARSRSATAGETKREMSPPSRAISLTSFDAIA